MVDLQQGIPTPISPAGENDALGTLVDQDLAAATTRPAEFTHTTADADDALRAEIAALLQTPDASPPPPSTEVALASVEPEVVSPLTNTSAPTAPASTDDEVLQQELAALLSAPAQPTPDLETQETPAAPVDSTDPDTAFADADAVLQQELAALLSSPSARGVPEAADALETAAALGNDGTAEPAPTSEAVTESAAAFEETFGVVEDVPTDIAPTPTPVPEFTTAAAPVYDTFPARDAGIAAAPVPAPAKPRRKSRIMTLCHDLLLTLAQLLDMPFRKIPAELKQYAGITGVVSATLGLSILLVLRFAHH